MANKTSKGSKKGGTQAKKGRAWKLERASVDVRGRSRPRSNKYSGGDTTKRPKAGTRERVWVGGYTRSDGTKVEGYYRDTGDDGGQSRSRSNSSRKSGGSRKRSSSGSKSSGRKSGSSRSRSRSQSAGGASQSQMTTDPALIRRWVEERGGRPACVRNTGDGDDIGVLRIDFPGYSGADTLQKISWEQFFEKFEERDLAFLYQEETAGGATSRFNKLVSREDAEELAMKAG